MAETAIAACDLAAVLGTVVGLNLLFHIPTGPATAARGRGAERQWRGTSGTAVGCAGPSRTEALGRGPAGAPRFGAGRTEPPRTQSHQRSAFACHVESGAVSL
ncbi:MAG: hypothetical protein A3K19_22345 [Lentisphaerae bacterium RIFOXYB12_FULL_65_16]|nr:MAG: hypothetical protein A3K18_31460 [Lentisphaerae bacterium RIFOXYA12_64_32]OGV91953.1 MAG: hypothetical protein A3K19_22345 [Lentisphaerae bacterium RIFOXYB12_FULL_65_16]